MARNDDSEEFAARNAEFISSMENDSALEAATRVWFERASMQEYSYHFEWMGRPVIQFPQDLVAMQEIIWEVRPDLILETGVARGGSVIFYSSMLEMMSIDGEVLGIDIDIRPHNRAAVEAHPMSRRISLIQGSSIDPEVIAKVRDKAAGKQRVIVILDSLHTHAHVAAELKAYSPLVTIGSYLVVYDTVIEDMPAEFSRGRPWAPGDNPKTAVHEFLRGTDDFEIDHGLQAKLQITVAPDGYLRRVR